MLIISGDNSKRENQPEQFKIKMEKVIVDPPEII
jgi:hypothetical protein